MRHTCTSVRRYRYELADKKVEAFEQCDEVLNGFNKTVEKVETRKRKETQRPKSEKIWYPVNPMSKNWHC
jgi:hypothetical protein